MYHKYISIGPLKQFFPTQFSEFFFLKNWIFEDFLKLKTILNTYLTVKKNY